MTARPLILDRAAQAALISWAIYLLIAPTVGFGWIDSWHNEQRAVQLILLGATTVVGVLTMISSREQVPWHPFVLLGLGSVSAAASVHRTAAFAEVGLYAMLGLAAYVAAIAARFRRQAMVTWLQRVALFIGAAHACGIAVRCAAAFELNGMLEPTVFMLGYANPRFASAFYVMLIPLIAAVVADVSARSSVRIAGASVLVVLWLANIGLGTRGVWFAFAVALPVAFIVFRPRLVRGQLVAMVGTALTAGLGYWALASALNPSPSPGLAGVLVPEGLQNLTLTRRDELWQGALQAIQAHPLLGIGPMQLAAVPTMVGSHPHNWALQVAAEWGVLAMIVLLLWSAKMALQVRRAVGGVAESSALASCALAVLAGLVLGLVDGNLAMPVSQSAFALLLGLLVGGCSSVLRTSSRVLSVAAISVFVLGLGVGTVQYAVSSYSSQKEQTLVFRRLFPGAWLTPRFWESGSLFPIGAETNN